MITMDEILTLMGYPSMIYCYLKSTTTELATLKTQTVSFVGLGYTCEVTNWEFCDATLPIRYVNGSCGCNQKLYNASGVPTVKHRFYFYIEAVNEEMDGEIVKCTVGTQIRETKEVHAITFTATPEKNLHICRGRSVTLNWEYEVTKIEIQQEYPLCVMRWRKTKVLTQSETELAYYSFPKPDQVRSHSILLTVIQGTLNLTR
ncbi:uncharacterized protein LOC131928651 [Physella acuta]|uniref:uncharacterized protein LOC131928651 n=1 Tax=Physella acuta TaxID=109671 RepID=UPI0027DE342E|nr:uncharacterized protein LOC131928651 [Physella acuta]